MISARYYDDVWRTSFPHFWISEILGGAVEMRQLVVVIFSVEFETDFPHQCGIKSGIQ